MITASPKRRISKYDLAVLYGLTLFSEDAKKIDGKALEKGWFTDEVLDSLSLSREEYKKIKIFTFPQTLKIIELFAIDKEDLVNLKMI